MIVFADKAKLRQRQTPDAPVRSVGTWMRIAEDPLTPPDLRQLAYRVLFQLLDAIR